ncbi:MAG: class I SAM-dependent methyltransferase [Desulfobacteraceae bacterium]|nr:class I SAM-dependent methyltransferase [Desulfobacteraceae bacterium]
MMTKTCETAIQHSTEDMYTSGEFWNELPDFLASQAPGKVSFLSEFIDFNPIVRNQPDISIADIGCGVGKVSTGLSLQLRDRYPDLKVNVFGFDLSPQAIQIAKRENTEGTFICGDFKESSMTWDLAILCDIIEHVPDPDDFICSVARKSRYFVIGFAMDDNLANRLLKSRREKVNKIGHISLFHEERAISVCKKYGKILNSGYIPNPIAPNFKITRLLHIFTTPLRILLRLLSRRIKGKVFGGESVYVFAESTLFSDRMASRECTAERS